MSKYLKIIFMLFVLYLSAFLVLSPQTCLPAARNALSLCAGTVIPVLFPFFVCSMLLTSLGFTALCTHFLSPLMRPLFNLPGSAAITFFLGILSGYPIGATTATEMYTSNQCTKTEAERMLAFCNNSGPLFVMGVLGCSYLGNPTAGRYLYASHILSAIITGIAFRFYKKNSTALVIYSSPNNAVKYRLSFGSIIEKSVLSILKICGFVVFFSVVQCSLPSNSLLCPFIEVVGGLKVLSDFESAYTLPLISFFLAFSGLSVVFQVSSIITPAGLSLLPYITGKLFQGALSFGITMLIQKVIPLSAETFSDRTNLFTVPSTPFSAFSVALSGIFFAIGAALFLSVVMSAFHRNKRY